MGDREDRIRDEAYRLWVEAGRPAGDETRHWLEAERRVRESDKADIAAQAKLADPPLAGPKRARASKAAGSVAAGLGSAAAKGLNGAEAEAFAQRRPAKRSADVAGAASAPAPGPAGAKTTLDRAKAGKPAPGKGAAVEIASARSRPKR